MTGGTDYTAAVGNYGVTLNDIVTGYRVFSNPAEYEINFLLAGPSGGITSIECQSKANELINIATTRKDCIAVISAPKEAVLNTSDSNVQTANIINFFAGVTPSNYAVFDSGHKYTYDRFNSQFLYLPCNPDVAGVMARTSIVQYPWYSPAGANRGVINNAIKLAYNPSQSQRDSLYSNAINPIIASPGQGIILFGDKTASNVVSAFDRINVRRLFLTIENQIGRVARAQLFEFNDVITRNNFVNIVEPYLRDIKAKRGITDFQIVCDESNNTPDVIDSNQFKADIYIKPARSINFINLTFVATRTGVSFSEIVGTV
jgi:phage tail sheath protein FI